MIWGRLIARVTKVYETWFLSPKEKHGAQEEIKTQIQIGGEGNAQVNNSDRGVQISVNSKDSKQVIN